MGQQLLNLPSSMGDPSWRIIKITSKFGTIVFKVDWQQFPFLLLTITPSQQTHCPPHQHLQQAPP